VYRTLPKLEKAGLIKRVFWTREKIEPYLLKIAFSVLIKRAPLDKQQQPACTYTKEFHGRLARIDKLGSNTFCKCVRQNGRRALTPEVKPTSDVLMSP
jgi:hypothetical protein